MIYMFSHDISFSNSVIEKVGEGEIFTDDTRMASATRERKPECMISEQIQQGFLRGFPKGH